MQATGLRTRLLKWYDRHKRDLPWRHTQDPYAILVSELMLQQTQVKTVIPYYTRFLAQFPSPQSLARAPLQKVLAAWAGLGYYRRARFLHAAAKAVVARGAFPDSMEDIRELPGVGGYTAAAVGSIAFGLRQAVVDGNVIRVACRLLELAGDPARGEIKKAVQQNAQDWLDPSRPGDFNQAMMELGATVCLPQNPSCQACPVSTLCQARCHASWDRFPQLAARPRTVQIDKAVALLTRGERVLMARRTGSGREGDAGRMLGFWHFPEIPLEGKKEKPADLAKARAGELVDGGVEMKGPLKSLTHSQLHYKINLQPYWLVAEKAEPALPWRFVGFEEAARLPLASAEKKLLGSLDRARKKRRG